MQFSSTALSPSLCWDSRNSAPLLLLLAGGRDRLAPAAASPSSPLSTGDCDLEDSPETASSRGRRSRRFSPCCDCVLRLTLPDCTAEPDSEDESLSIPMLLSGSLPCIAPSPAAFPLLPPQLAPAPASATTVLLPEVNEMAGTAEQLVLSSLARSTACSKRQQWGGSMIHCGRRK